MDDTLLNVIKTLRDDSNLVEKIISSSMRHKEITETSDEITEKARRLVDDSVFVKKLSVHACRIAAIDSDISISCRKSKIEKEVQSLAKNIKGLNRDTYMHIVDVAGYALDNLHRGLDLDDYPVEDRKHKRELKTELRLYIFALAVQLAGEFKIHIANTDHGPFCQLVDLILKAAGSEHTPFRIVRDFMPLYNKCPDTFK